ncbi:hypothetical protein Cgig2_026694 [Carnegiea gigantea]|uniref:NAC domain-containing protein n=1 Tax=Carnegiea gigantea TaxID=171969 RepID=A0A9Q1GKE3_9CARY|nr:hypothetical protein Cgig2_026694 [Carnegiea gigantea]
MWSIEDVLSELKEEDRKKEKSGGLPPGFRFHPTDEELITFYLASKVFTHPPPPPPDYPNLRPLTTSTSFFAPPVDIPEVDLNRCEPWDLPERAKMGEREWYFYSVRDRKYPTGLRTNRATGSGYWKATGKDRHVYATASSNHNNNNYKKKKGSYNYHDGDHELALIGMKKTLVFYQGRAPRGVKTPWVMHEYRLDGHFSSFRLSSSKVHLLFSSLS